MQNKPLPQDLKEKIEKLADEYARTYTGTKTIKRPYLAGASFLYALLKEEKGEVAGVWRSVKQWPEVSGSFYTRKTTNGGETIKDVSYYDPRRKDLWESAGITEWLDTETPVVAGCGELVEILESIRDYWNRDRNDSAMHDACWYAINAADEAIAKFKTTQP